MLAARLDDYAEMLEDPPIVEALENVQKDPANAFETAILGPLKKLREPEEGRRFLLVDALDEALTLLARDPRQLAGQLQIVCLYLTQ